MKRLLLAVLTALVMVVVSGCTVVGVSGYGDSLIARKADWLRVNNKTAAAQAAGDALINAFTFTSADGEFRLSSYGWFSVPGSTMYNHPNWAAGLDKKTAKPQVVVYSFGTNDAVGYAERKPGFTVPATALGQADLWIQRARDQGAKCVIWIKPLNKNLYLRTNDQKRDYTNWIDDFNSKLEQRSAANQTSAFKLELIDWPAILREDPVVPTGRSFDGLHPNQNGGTVIGRQIQDLIRGKDKCGQ